MSCGLVNDTTANQGFSSFGSGAGAPGFNMPVEAEDLFERLRQAGVRAIREAGVAVLIAGDQEDIGRHLAHQAPVANDVSDG